MTRTAPRREPVAELKFVAVLPHVQRVSEPLRRCQEQQAFAPSSKSDTTLRSHLVRPKDTVDPAKQDSVVYRIPCECGKVQGDLCRRLLKNAAGIYESPVPRPPPPPPPEHGSRDRPLFNLERGQVY